MSDADKDFAHAVALALRDRRLKAGLTLGGLAERAGLHRTSLGLLERGERHLTLASAKRLADALGCPLAEIIQQAESLSRRGGA